MTYSTHKPALIIIGVMGPGDGATADDCEAAYQLGRSIADRGWVVLTGGRNAGVMDAANRGAKDAGGLTIGILPGCDRTSMSAAVDIPIVTALGNARNAINALSSHVMIACGIGAGTASEIALALKEQTPVILLNHSPETYSFFQQLTRDHVWMAPSPDDAVAIAQRLLEQQAFQ
ncbi:MAG: TIGR00725 family protein [Elainellaceae cyanobacterium]